MGICVVALTLLSTEKSWLEVVTFWTETGLSVSLTSVTLAVAVVPTGRLANVMEPGCATREFGPFPRETDAEQPDRRRRMRQPARARNGVTLKRREG